MSTTTAILLIGALGAGAYLYVQSQKAAAPAATTTGVSYSPAAANLTTGMGATPAPANQGGSNEWDVLLKATDVLGGLFGSKDKK